MTSGSLIRISDVLRRNGPKNNLDMTDNPSLSPYLTAYMNPRPSKEANESRLHIPTLCLLTSTLILNPHPMLAGTAVAVLQIGMSLVRSQMVSVEFFIDIILPIALWSWGRLSL